MKIVKGESGVDQTNAFDEVNVTIRGVQFDIDTLPRLVITPQKQVDMIYEKLAPNEVFIISLQGDTLLYVVNRLGTAHLEQATLE